MSRNRARILVGCLLLLGVGVGVGRVLDGEDSGKRSPRGLVAFSEPPRIASANGAVNAALTAQVGLIAAGPQRVNGRSYNGEFVGPTLVMQPGDTLNLDLQNDLGQETNIHYHGFHVSPLAPSDDVVDLMVPPGRAYSYVVPIPDDHDQGTFWYHSHAHGLSEGQVFGGMSGAAIIGHQPFPGYTDRLFALKDFQVEDREIPSANIDSDAHTTRTVNGLVDPVLTGRPGDIQFWRLANIGADIFYKVALDDHEFHVVGEDGNPVSTRWASSQLVLPPGKRYDVYVQFGNPGTHQLRTLEYSTGPAGDKYPPATLATLSLTGQRSKPRPLPRRAPESRKALPPATGPSRNKVLTEDADGFYINGREFDPNRIDDNVRYSAVEDWTIVNKTQEQHPIHVHQDDFWVIAKDGKPYDWTGQQDTVIVEPGHSVTIRIPFKDFTGKFVYHCHILAHEDGGMMGVVDVERVGARRARPGDAGH